jgi:hypothetical protein
LAEGAAYKELVGGGADKGTAGLLDLLANLLTPGERPGLQLEDAANPMALSKSIDLTRINIAKVYASASAGAVSSYVGIYDECQKKAEAKNAGPNDEANNEASCRSTARQNSKRKDFDEAVAAVTAAFIAPSQTQQNIILKGLLLSQQKQGSAESNAPGGVVGMTPTEMDDAAKAGAEFVDKYFLAKTPKDSKVLAAVASVTKNNHKPMINYLWSEGARGGTNVRHLVLTSSAEGKQHILSVYDNVPIRAGTKNKKKQSPIAPKSYTLRLLHNGEPFGANARQKAPLAAQGQRCDTFFLQNFNNNHLKRLVRRRALVASASRPPPISPFPAPLPPSPSPRPRHHLPVRTTPLFLRVVRR